MAKSKKQASENVDVPVKSEVGGYVTVKKACGMVNASSNYTDESGELKECLPSTINYWLRTGDITGIKLDSDIKKDGTPDYVLLISRHSVQAYIDALPSLVEKRKEADRKKEELDALDKERKAAIARLEEEYKAKKAALAPSETATA